MTESSCDVAIIGAGPAGLQAAIHAAGKKVKVVVFGKPENSSMYRARVANYCCSEQILSGKDMLEAGRRQAEKLDTLFVDEDIVETKQEANRFSVVTESGLRFESKALILATGVARRELRVKGEKRLVGHGVSYCVDCDANFFRNQDVAVVGRKSAAATGAMTLLRFAKTVSLIAPKMNVNESLRKQVKGSDIRIIEDAWVTEIVGVNEVEGVVLTNGEKLKVDGVFIELGAKGAMELAANLGVLFDAETFSYVETNRKQETNIPGLYAAGDIAGPPWQIAKAVGEGCVAGMEAAEYAKGLDDSQS